MKTVNRTKKCTAMAALGAALVLGGPRNVAAQTLGERVEALEEKVEQGRASLADALGIDIHGFVAADYLYNFNDPDSHTNQFRVFDNDANSVTLNQANLYFARSKEDESVGFVANLDFGKTAEVVGGVTRWSNNPSNSESLNSFELREAYLTYKTPFSLMPDGDPIVLKGGKFVTLHGAEIIKNYNGFNYNVSASVLFGFAIPFTHTGLMASIPIGSMLALDLGVVNGWDNVVDNNDGKTLHAGLKIAPVDTFSLYLSGSYGPEQNDNGNSKRTMLTALATLNATDALTFIVDANYGTENDVPDPFSTPVFADGTRDADWYGVAGYAIYSVTDRLQLSLRSEVFDDPDGVRTLFQESGFGPGVTVWEITPTVSYKVTEGLLWRAEYRHDETDRQFFEKESGFQRGQDTIATEFIYAF
jgi:hypothetical protein